MLFGIDYVQFELFMLFLALVGLVVACRRVDIGTLQVPRAFVDVCQAATMLVGVFLFSVVWNYLWSWLFPGESRVSGESRDVRICFLEYDLTAFPSRLWAWPHRVLDRKFKRKLKRFVAWGGHELHLFPTFA